MAKSTLLHRAKRSTYALWALVLFVAVMIPGLQASRVHAYGLLTNRLITMSNSSVGTLTDGQNVVYKLEFEIATTGNIGSIRLQFCNNSPIINDSSGCDAITGFSTNHTTTTVTAQTGGVGTWSVSAVGSNSSTLLITQGTAQSVATTPLLISITLGDGTSGNGFTNPTNLQTFYGRIMTYSSTDGTGTEVDAGGVALATSVSLDITSIVKERLTFCVYRGGTCAGSGNPPDNSFDLGNTQGVLDTTGPYVDTQTKYDVASNAVGKVIVRIRGTTLMSGPSRSISAIGATPAVSANNTEQFGFCSFMNSGSTGINIDDKYDGGGGTGATSGTECASTSDTNGNASPGGAGTAEFAFDDNLSDGTRSTYGDEVAEIDPGQTATGTLVFIGNVRDTTEAGIYTTTLNLIATGKY